ncbi:hypothetical protein GCM10009677_20180 [Sphaerisporangium rubeum]|uniref:Uncharacterized protein n=1 Tax=Sphaerisporangium rubeum TaxID=321317 RepID=A0A7X0IG08_9ACTN|nr:hypothetical protein [Sphaerisporangium rubeum]MBB6473889.1 hypothetical protein [Sphaerisporangium rubeum]
MRSRLPAFLAVLLSAFLLGPGPGGVHLAAAQTGPAVTAESAVAWAGPVLHAGHDAAHSRPHLAAGSPAAPLPPAVLPSTGRTAAGIRPLTTAGEPYVPTPGPAARRAPARGPPSTTR